MTRRLRAISTTRPVASKLVTCFALLAFLLQGLALQTHIHQQLQPVIAKLALVDSQPAVQAGQTSGKVQGQPLKTHDPLDQGNCRICHELVHAGSYIVPTAIALIAGLGWSLVHVPAPAPAAGIPAQAFAWQSRGPPQN